MPSPVRPSDSELPASANAPPVAPLDWPALEQCTNLVAMGLTTREREIIALLLTDAKERAIAEQLCISPHTVHTHVARVYRKLGVTSRLQLAVWLLARATNGRDRVSPAQPT